MNKAANTEIPSQPGAGKKEAARTASRSRILAGLLIGMGLLYLITLPWQRRMAAETARIERENLVKQAEAARLATENKSIETARSQVERNPGDPRAQLELAQLYAASNRLEEAAARAQIAVGLAPKNLEPLLALADIEQRARHYDAAMRAYKAALAVAPDDPRPRIGLAYLYVSFGWPLEAEALLKPAIAADPQNPHLKVALALAYVQHADYVAAEKLLRETQQAAPDDATLWSPLVHVYNEMGRYRDAIGIAQNVLTHLPNNAAILNEMGKAYYHLNDFPHAETAFQQVLAMAPDDLTAHYYRALCFQRTDQIPAAVTELEYVYRKNPGFEQTRQILGKLYMRVNRAEEGQRLTEEAARLQAGAQKHTQAGLLVSTKPGDPEAHLRMAEVYYDEQNSSRALVEVRKALDLNPNNQAAQQLLAKLQSAGTR